MKITRVISGGQTGADRAALDAAIENGVPHGGWCPKGRRAEDGPISSKYHLQETESADYAVRTRANVADSDLTLIFSHGPLIGGSLLTQRFAEELGKPCVHIDLDEGVCRLDAFLPHLEKAVVNVAGPRASSDALIYDAVFSVVCGFLHSQRC